MATSSNYNQVFLPGTKARIPASIKLYFITPTSATIPIGAATSMEVSIRRDISKRYQLDSDYPGSIEELVPGRLEEILIRLSRVMLYNGKISGTSGSSGGDWARVLTNANLMYNNVGLDIILQHKPFIIKEERYAPSTNSESDTPKIDEVILYKGCYVTDVPYRYDITGEWIISQEITVQATSVEYGSSQ
ncbi:MAG: hypothetical protein QXD43_01620 [Candidatus Aenigmatarchaeota archaeon]